MRNQVLKLSAAGVLVLALVVTATWMHRASPHPPLASDPKREETQRAQAIVDEVKQGRVGHARALADRFYRAYPKSPEIQNIERLTGYHPRPYGP